MITRAISICCLLLLGPCAWAEEAVTTASEAGMTVPLNLSRPDDATRTGVLSDAPAHCGARQRAWREAGGAGCVPYGTGYEARRGMGCGMGRRQRR